jgi:hypothetical protein
MYLVIQIFIKRGRYWILISRGCSNESWTKSSGFSISSNEGPILSSKANNRLPSNVACNNLYQEQNASSKALLNVLEIGESWSQYVHLDNSNLVIT